MDHGRWQWGWLDVRRVGVADLHLNSHRVLDYAERAVLLEVKMAVLGMAGCHQVHELLVLGLLDHFDVVEFCDLGFDDSSHNVLYHLILSVKNDISKLSEVLDDVVGLKVAVNDHHLLFEGVLLEVRVVDELFEQWVQNSVVLLALREPRLARQTKGWVWVFKEVDHVVQGKVLLAVNLVFERSVLWEVDACELPEDAELLDRAVLLHPRLAHRKLFDDDV